MTEPPAAAARGMMIAAPQSGAGKTVLTLALLRAFRRGGLAVCSAKSGPDYIDPKFHEAASGRPCVNLDAFAMQPDLIRGLAAGQVAAADLFIVEAAMGLFDGAASGKGSAADLACLLALPVILVVDCARQSQSVAALVHGFAGFRSDIKLAGLILNRVGSARHEVMLRRALEPLGIPVLGAVPRDDALSLPDRHLGLVQAEEHADLERFLDGAAGLVEDRVDVLRLKALASVPRIAGGHLTSLPPLGQRIAVARDRAFAFSYPHVLAAWQRQGASVHLFSPLADEAPDAACDSVYLPGGYPELYAGRLAANSSFRAGVLAAARRGARLYGECGGYMTLGESLIDADRKAHEMLGLLPLVTSFADRRRHLGYRVLAPVQSDTWLGPGKRVAHEFHYASIVHEGEAQPLFAAFDADGAPLPDMGLRRGSVMGSFAHLIA